ncbi:hypothetical protein E2562_020007 [Oryza meyeriana var. granulata]|uniref:Uncharacterized protein n=1 Tax=Oryza meyeriana var. granulata TaxID=110450 RepID=A0A6G1CFX0_9ORYZ|nr:hypothetical protein E2562_020007 [Oryza meyeriana var. granulata]
MGGRIGTADEEDDREEVAAVGRKGGSANDGEGEEEEVAVAPGRTRRDGSVEKGGEVAEVGMREERSRQYKEEWVIDDYVFWWWQPASLVATRKPAPPGDGGGQYDGGCRGGTGREWSVHEHKASLEGSASGLEHPVHNPYQDSVP